MARVTVQLPSVLSIVVGDERRLTVEAESLAAALEQLIERWPGLRGHLFDEAGSFREHVLCFHNQTSTRWLPSLDVPLAEGDVVTILQAVSGG